MENKNELTTLEVIGLVAFVIIVAPVIINGVLIIGASIYNALQPKIYELTITHEDGISETYRGTKKELKKIIKDLNLKTEAV